MANEVIKPEFFYFDLGNVLYFFDYAIGLSRASNLSGVDEERLRSAVYDFGLEELYESGFIDSERFGEEIFRTVGKSFDLSGLLDSLSAMFTFNREIVPVIQALQQHNIPLGILSNTCPAHWDWIKQQGDLDFRHAFREIVLSYEVGRMKPYAEIYAAAERAAAVAPEKIYFIDDRAVNVHSAAQRGWQALLFTDAQSVLDVIRRW